MSSRAPHVVVLAGPNGAGKSTAAPWLLRGELGVEEFVNADVIAQGLSGFRPETAAIEAGRVMLTHLAHLTRRRATFAFETTLSGRTVAAQLTRLRNAGYDIRLVYLWLPSADIAVERVRQRVAVGGHDVPEQVIRRRFRSGLRNLTTIYLPLATRWRVYNSSGPNPLPLVARRREQGDVVYDPETWRRILAEGRHVERTRAS